MHAAVDILEDAVGREDPTTVLTVTQKAIASSFRVIMRADDSSGIIGDACRRLLALHPIAAADARPPVATLVDWMVRVQFEEECDFFEVDPAAYAPVLGELGIASYRRRLQAIAEGLGERPAAAERWRSPDAGTWFRLEQQEQRLAVVDRDVAEIIRTHARDRKVAAYFQDTAEALAEIGELDLAIEWARQGAEAQPRHQAQRAGDLWCRLLAGHRPEEVLAARRELFRRWPSSSTATELYRAAGAEWPTLRAEVMDRLSASPRDAVLFTLLTLHDVPLAWTLAHDLALDDDDAWDRVGTAYERVDPIAVLPVHARLVDTQLREADAAGYRRAARRLATMRRLAAGTTHAVEVDDLVAALRKQHYRRPRLQREFDRAGLP